MIKTIIAITSSLLITNASNAQTNFSGTWSDPELEMISGIQYSNAVPKQIKVTQSKDSLKLESISAGNDGDVTNTTTIALNGKQSSRISKTSGRTIRTTATWNDRGTTLTILTLYSYANNPHKAEFTNTEVWELSDDGNLKIVKTSDADVTDDWTIKGIYKKG